MLEPDDLAAVVDEALSDPAVFVGAAIMVVPMIVCTDPLSVTVATTVDGAAAEVVGSVDEVGVVVGVVDAGVTVVVVGAVVGDDDEDVVTAAAEDVELELVEELATTTMLLEA